MKSSFLSTFYMCFFCFTAYFLLILHVVPQVGAECSKPPTKFIGVNCSFTFRVFFGKKHDLTVTIIGNLLYLDSMNISPCSFLLSELNCCINFLLLIELFINCFEPFSKEQNTDSSNYCRLQISFLHLKCPCEMEN